MLISKDWKHFTVLLVLTFAILSLPKFDMVVVVKAATSMTIQTDSPKNIVDINGKIKVFVKSTSVTWKSSNKKIAIVNKNGIVTGKKSGTVEITAISKTNDGVKGSITLKVKNIKPNNIALNKNKTTLYENGKTLQLKAIPQPIGVYSRGVTFKSSNTKVATVSKRGVISPKKKGTATITVRTKESNKTSKCVVTVKQAKDNQSANHKVQIEIGNKRFKVTLYDNDAAHAFEKRLPMTLNMSELNGNEKYFYLSESLPASASVPSSIHTGDLMLYGADCLVLFYEGFSTSYSYTSLGYVEDTEGLAKALGKENVNVKFDKAE